MAEELIVKIVGDASKLKGELDKASGHVSGFSDKIGKLGKVATIGGAAITAAFTKAFLDFTTYETKLIDMAKVTSEPFDIIEERLKTLDPILGSSTELMEGYYQVISAGVKDPIEALDLLTVAAEAGKAAHVAQSEVVEGITKMMAGYEGAIRDASEAADLLFAIEKEGQVTVAALIPIIGGLAKMSFDLNIEQEAMAASMAVISKTAGSAAEAATQYQAVLTGLMKPTKDMTLAMEDMGYATAEEAIAEKGLVEVLKHLEEYMDRTSVSAGKLFGRKEAMLGFSALGAEGFRTLDETIVSVGEGMGGAAKAFDLWSESGEAAIADIKNTFLNFTVMIGEKIAPTVKDLLGTVTDIIDRVMEWADENEELTEKIIKWGAALGAALLILGPILIMLPGLISGITLLSGAFLPFAIGGAIILGIKKLSDYLGDVKVKAFEAASGFREMSLEMLNIRISETEETIADLTVKLDEADKGFTIFGITLKNQDANIGRLKQVIKDYKIELGLLEEQRDELTKAEEEGIDVTEERAKLDEEAKKLSEELAEAVKKEEKALKGKAKSAEFANAQTEIGNKIYALTHDAMEIAIRDLDLLKQSYLDKGIAQEVVNKWYALEIIRLEELNKGQRKHVDIMKEVAKITEAVTDKIYELTHTPYEVKIKAINERYDDYIEIVKEAKLALEEEKIEIDKINIARDLEIKTLEKLRKKEEENVSIMKEVAKITKKVTDRIYELIHTPYEVKLKAIQEEYDGYIEIIKEAKLSLEEEKIAIDNVNIARDLEIKTLDELIKKEEEGEDQKAKLADAYKTIEDRIYELTHTAMEYQIKKLEEERQAYLDLGVSLELVDELFDLQIAKLGKVGDAFLTLENTVKPVIMAITGYLETQLANAISGLLGGMGDFEWSWATFWEGLKNVLINAVAAMIAKLIVLAAFSWLFNLIGWPVSWLGMDKGGGVGYDIGGQVQRFDPGGAVDTVPARLTLGEYVVAKPMTDFIKRFRMFPIDLVDAIAGGLPTPVPAFATGGPVGTSNITTSSFGEIKIYVDIHDNRFSDDVDIKSLATKVSDEILRKLNLNRRH